MGTPKCNIFRVVVFAVAVWLLSLAFHKAVEQRTREVWHFDTVEVVRVDTVVVERIERKVQRVEVLRVDTVWLETVRNPDTLRVDSVRVQIPITRKVYADSLFRAVVSGFRPRLDSLTIYERERIIAIPQQTQRARGWGFSAGLQAGYGVTPKGMQPYGGFGVQVGYTF